MNELQVLSYENASVEVVVLNDVVLFNAKDVANVLEIVNIRTSIVDFDEDEKVKVTNSMLNSKVRSTYNRKLHNTGEMFLTEAGVYKLIFVSRKPEAKAFQKWVTKEVLPQIRKTGSYGVIQSSYMIADPIERANRWIEEEKERRALALELTQTKDVVELLTHTEKTYTATVIAKELGMSAVQLNKKLHEDKIIYKRSGVWVLYAQYEDLGYMEIKQVIDDNGMVHYYSKWTDKGRQFILEKYSK